MAEQWPSAARPRPESERALVSRRTRQAVPCCLPYSSPFSAAHGREMLRQPCPASGRPAPGRRPLFSPRLKCAAFRVPRGTPHCLPPALCPVRAICSRARIPLGIAPLVPPKCRPARASGVPDFATQRFLALFLRLAAIRACVRRALAARRTRGGRLEAARAGQGAV